MHNTIRIEKLVNAPVERVFAAFLTPADLLNWHNAGDGWTTPRAHVDPRENGKFRIAYQDPKGETSFDLEGEYTKIDKPNHIAYTMADGRQVKTDFEAIGDATKVYQEFEMENENSEDLQRHGWLAHLNNLENYLANEIID